MEAQESVPGGQETPVRASSWSAFESALVKSAERATSAISLLGAQEATYRQAGEAAAQRLSIKDEFDRVAQCILERAQERTLGVYNRLLSHLLHEVIQHTDRVADLRIQVERGAPGLYVGIKRIPDGISHSVLRNSGGAVTDVICTGLQMLALYRSGGTLRPFIVMDEPDKWIEAWRIGRFYKVLRDLAQQMGLQAVIVSHHPLNVVLPDGIPDDGSVRVLRVRRPVPSDGVDGQAILVRQMISRTEGDSTVFEESNADIASHLDPDAGVQSIRLIDFLSHARTTYALGKGLTFITGSNDIGKSALTEAILCATDGEGTDEMIADGAAAAQVEITTQDGTLNWRRVRTGSPKEVYRWTPREGSGGREMEESGGRGSCPAWVTDMLRIGRQNGIQVQAVRQKSKVFLLEETPMQRAQVLSLGQESTLIFDIIEAHRKQQRDDAAVVRVMESNLESIRQKKQRLSDRALSEDSVAQHLDAALRAAHDAQDAQKRAHRIASIVRAAEQASALRDVLSSMRDAQQRAMDRSGMAQRSVDVVQRVARAGIVARKRDTLRSALAGLQGALHPDLEDARPRTPRLRSAIHAAKTITTLQFHLAALRSTWSVLRDYDIAQDSANLSRVAQLAARLDGLGKADLAYRNAQRAACQWVDRVNSVQKERAQVRDAMGPLCPLCQQPWEVPHAHHAE